ncbi:hypothetical protein M1D47_21160 [Bacillus sp. R1-10]
MDKIMVQIGADPRLNPEVEEMRWAKGTRKDGSTYYYKVPKRDEVTDEIIKGPKFIREELMSMEIENVLDLYVAEQLGHNDSETNADYRSEEAKKRREEFRKTMKEKNRSSSSVY